MESFLPVGFPTTAMFYFLLFEKEPFMHKFCFLKMAKNLIKFN
jgi:hypothetical protein|nr:MAG TPA: hypothetical protein [Caudoviricetes sp.]DAO04279.1 MAG TPA: hypothetical protein [Caudoviricetes sp.]DAQ84283.1 MAG TPA: hypothetical protein [Caudoviricetes sp.]DAR86292.1 MAG TPA: hypothetical protein [Caudoviricetes sp.]DAS32606.1 MAG TPA: hypothetical protein [Caudoviricetes sp.]